MAGPAPVPLRSIAPLNDFPAGGVVLISYPDPVDPTKRIFGAVATDAIAKAKANAASGSGSTDVPVSAITFAPSLNSPDLFAVSQDGTLKKTNLASILALGVSVGANMPPATTAPATTTPPATTAPPATTTPPATTAPATTTPPATTAPATTAPPASNYVKPTSVLPNVLHILDFAAPVSSAPLVVGTSGIHYTGTGLDVDSIEDAVSGQLFQNGFGKVQYHASGGPGGRPYVHCDASCVNSGYDSIHIPDASSNLMFGPPNNPWAMIAVVRQTAPGNLGLIAYTGGGISVNVIGVGGATDGAMRWEQNSGSALGNETSGSATALNQWQVVLITCDGSKGAIYRNNVNTLVTPAGIIGGIPTGGNGRLLNQFSGDCTYIELINGLPSNADLTTQCQQVATLCGLGTLPAITVGSTTATQPVARDLRATFLQSVNFPKTGPLLTRAGADPGHGLTLGAGATPYFSMVFGTATANANITTDQGILDNFFTTYMEGDLSSALGSPMDTGQGNNNTFAAVARTYAADDPNRVHMMRADGVALLARASQNGTDTGPGRVFAGLLRANAQFRPGMVIKVRYKGPVGAHSWCPIWLFSGLQYTPGPGGNPYQGYGTQQSLYKQPSNNHLYEIDINDNYIRDDHNVTRGCQVDFGTPNIYGNAWTKPPQNTYYANGGGYTFYPGDAAVLDQPVNFATDFHDLVLDWFDNNYMNVIIDGKVVLQHWIDFSLADDYVDLDGVTRKMPLHLLIGNQAIPSFSPNPVNVPENDGITDGWTIVVQEISAWHGNIANADSLRVNAGVVTPVP